MCVYFHSLSTSVSALSFVNLFWSVLQLFLSFCTTPTPLPISSTIHALIYTTNPCWYRFCLVYFDILPYRIPCPFVMHLFLALSLSLSRKSPKGKKATWITWDLIRIQSPQLSQTAPVRRNSFSCNWFFLYPLWFVPIILLGAARMWSLYIGSSVGHNLRFVYLSWCICIFLLSPPANVISSTPATLHSHTFSMIMHPQCSS